MMEPCPFCEISAERIIAKRASAFVIDDGFPVSPGHRLIVPFRHVATWFDSTCPVMRGTSLAD